MIRHLPPTIGPLHFTGIGGIGMSGIAEVLHDLGYTVRGSDIKDSPNVQRLRDKGIAVEIGHDAAHAEGAAAIVISSAIQNNNPELQAARAAKIPVVRRAAMLAELMRLKRAIVVGGTHGKTTTTSLIGALLEEGGFDPTVINGGIVNSYGTNTRLGQSEWMVAESDESDGTFTRLPATVAVVTNIDPEHLEYYGSFDNVRKAYRRFVENLPFYGYAVLCLDHPEVQALLPELTDRRTITYGFSPQAAVRGENIHYDAGGTTFDVIFENGDTLRDVHLAMAGEHNVQNALAALAIAHEMEIPAALIKKALSGFSGVKRRFTKTGEVAGITIIDDYAHHPVEIAATLKAARSAVREENGRVIAVMQPHRYSRLADLFEEFCSCFNDADTVVIANVYAAGESRIEGADRDSLAEGVRGRGHRDVRILETPDALPELISKTARSKDIVVCMGAGDITAWAQALPEQLQERLQADQTTRTATGR